MNRYLIFFFMLFLFACKKKENHNSLKTSKFDDHSINEKQLNKTIRQLVKSNNSDSAFKLIDTLMYLNKNNGFLYFEKGYLELRDFQDKAAMSDFKTAESLNYNKSECKKMIHATQILINATNK